MAARFPQGMSIQSTRSTAQVGKVAEPPKGLGPKGGPVRGNNMQGMPGYIKTATDTSSGGLTSAKSVGPRFNEGETTATTNKTVQMRDQGAYIGQRGGKSNGAYLNGKFRGSSDSSYRATSTGKPGQVRIMGQPKAPASRAASEKEGPSRGEYGSKTAVSNGGVRGANKLPPQGVNRGKPSGHAMVGGGRGTMESLRGRVNTSKSMGMGKRAGSKMY